MRRSSVRACLAGWMRLAVGIAVLVVCAGTRIAAAEDASVEAQQFQRVVKTEERELIQSAAQEQLRELEEARAHLGSGRGSQAARARAAWPGARGARPVESVERFRRAAPRLGASAVADAPPNRWMNDRSRDLTEGSTQAEVAIAAWGPFRVGAWNDAESHPSGTVGYAWSPDQGTTWIDGGGPPLGGGVARWVGDPVMTVDARSGTFVLAAMVIAAGPRSGIAIARGRFMDRRFQWDTPTLVRSTRDTLPDKPWIAADSLSGRLYLSYTSFFRVGGTQVGEIEIQRSPDGGDHWDPPLVLSSRTDLGLVQGSRPAVGPDGTVYTVWMAVDTTLTSGGRDWIRFRASHDGGASFSEQENVAGVFANLASGGPGFNRGWGLLFPGIAVDRSHGPYRGHVYVIWNESLDYLHDPPRASHARLEREPDDDPGSAVPFSLGETLRGTIAGPGDIDTWRLFGERGETVTFEVDSAAANLGVAMLATCSDGATRLAYSAPIIQGRERVLIFTMPRNDIYYLRLTASGDSGGGYRVKTGTVSHGEGRARDQRDVYLSARGPFGRWSPPVRVNQEDPWFDDWLPEVAVAANGNVYAAWYDWRVNPDVNCGGTSTVMLARSTDGGSSWTELGPLSDRSTPWSEIGSMIAPNQGDYIGLVADSARVVAAWSDGRLGDPDAVTSERPVDAAVGPAVATAPRIEAVAPNPAHGLVDVSFVAGGGSAVVLELVDLAGRRVRALPLGALAPGRHSARLALGDDAPPGIYWVRLEEGSTSAARRLVHLP